MNNKHLILLTIMIWANTLHGQDNRNFTRIQGFCAGTGFSTFHSQKASKSFQPKPIFFLGYYYGRIYPKMNYTLTYGFENKGARKKDGNWEYNLYYITTEPSLKVKLQPFNSSFILGCYGSILLFNSVSADNKELAQYTIEGFKKTDFGGLLGFQVNLFSLSQIPFFFDIQANYSLISVYENKRFYLSDRESKWDKNLTLKIGLNIMIK